jgi:hypothetical protein
MKTPLRLLALTPISVIVLFAQNPVVPWAGGHAIEMLAEFSYAGGSRIAEGTRPQGEIETSQGSFNFSRTVPINERSSWSYGGVWQHLAFSPDGSAPIPNQLTAMAVKLRYNRALSPRWMLGAGIAPGVYSDFENQCQFVANGNGNYNAPADAHFVYAATSTLRWVLGVNADFRGGHPLVGGGGVVWQLSQYALTREFTLFAGANLRTATYRVANDFGRRHRRPELDNQDVDYRELNAEAGARWQFTPQVALHAAAGWMFDRRLAFHDCHLLLNGDGAPSARVQLSGTF